MIRMAVAMIVSLMLGNSGAAESLYQWSPPAPHHASVVTVHAADGSAGSGVYCQWAELRFVLTAAHVVEKASTATVTFPSGRSADGQITVDRDRHDLGAVLIGRVEEPAASIAARAPANGQQIEVCGYGGPRSQFRHFLCNPLAGLNANQQSADGRVTYGDSGGPWFVGGEVVGIQSTGADPIGSVDTFDIFARCQSANTQCLQNFADRVFRRNCPGGQCLPQPAGPGGPQRPPQGIGADDMYPPRADPGSLVPVPPLHQDPPVPPIAAAPAAGPIVGPAGPAGPPGTPGADGQTPHIDLDGLRAAIERLSIARREIPRHSSPWGMPAIDLALSALGIGGGVSLPIWAAWMLARTMWHRRVGSSVARGSTGTASGTQPTVTPHNPPALQPGATGSASAPTPHNQTSTAVPFPISIDAPPTPQYRAVDQRFVTVETDRYEQAHAYAAEQLARRYPASVTYIESMKSLINQFLAGAKT